MQTSRGASRVILIESIGFGVIIAISWLDEVARLPQALFGEVGYVNWKESALETAIVLMVAIPTLVSSSRVTRRLYHLEGFLRLCSWCRRLEADGKWVQVEDFVAHRLDTATSHGICPDCNAKMLETNPATGVPG
jgi:hypothetical protein